MQGATPLEFQWYFEPSNGLSTNAILDATNSTLTVTNVQAADVGSYQLFVTNTYGNTNSDPLPLVIVPGTGPSIVGQPVWREVFTGFSREFSSPSRRDSAAFLPMVVEQQHARRSHEPDAFGPECPIEQCRQLPSRGDQCLRRANQRGRDALRDGSDDASASISHGDAEFANRDKRRHPAPFDGDLRQRRLSLFDNIDWQHQ